MTHFIRRFLREKHTKALGYITTYEYLLFHMLLGTLHTYTCFILIHAASASSSSWNNDDPTYLFCCWGLYYIYYFDDESLIEVQEHNDNDTGLRNGSGRITSLRARTRGLSPSVHRRRSEGIG